MAECPSVTLAVRGAQIWALLASGQIKMRKIDGWQTLDHPIAVTAIDLTA